MHSARASSELEARVTRTASSEARVTVSSEACVHMTASSEARVTTSSELEARWAAPILNARRRRSLQLLHEPRVDGRRRGLIGPKRRPVEAGL